MKSKSWIKIGSIAAISFPVASLVSCGTVDNPSQKELNNYKVLTDSNAIKSLEEEWQLEVIDHQFAYKKFINKSDKKLKEFKEEIALKNDKIDLAKKYVKAAILYIKQKLQSDSNFIKKIGESLGKSGKNSKDKNGNPERVNKFSIKWLLKNGLLNEYPYGKIDFIGTAPKTNEIGITDEGLKFLILEPTSGFSVQLNKFVIAKNYLTNISKNDWEKTFPEMNNNWSASYKKDIQEDQFLIVKNAMEKKYFAKWHIELDEDESLAFTNMTKTPYNDILKALKGDSNKLGNNIKYSKKRTLYNGAYDKLMVSTQLTPYTEFLNYQGISTMDSKGDKNLSFSNSALKKYTKRSQWEGFIVPNKEEELINDAKAKEIDLTTKHDSGTDPIKISFDYVKGFMPIYSSKFKFEDDDFKNQVAELIAFNNPDVYNEAMNFYTTKIEGDSPREAIYIKIANKKYKKYLNEKGIRFIKASKPEDNPEN